MKDDSLYLLHIDEALDKIIAYTHNGHEAFISESVVQDAVIRNFEIIGEATKRLSEETKSKEPDIPWRSVAGFRDILIHDYMGVDLNEVWNVVEFHIPALKQAVTRLLKLKRSIDKINSSHGDDLNQLS